MCFCFRLHRLFMTCTQRLPLSSLYVPRPPIDLYAVVCEHMLNVSCIFCSDDDDVDQHWRVFLDLLDGLADVKSTCAALHTAYTSACSKICA